MTAAVTLDNVSCVFGRGAAAVRAVDGVSLAIDPGEFFTLLGPSGSGKTTCLRMIGGFTLPTAGRVLIGGENVSQRPPYARPVNTVCQDYALFPHMDIRANVGYALMVRKVEKAERDRRADEMLALVGLPGVAERRPAQLSGGQRQRVVGACADQPAAGAAARLAARRARPEAARAHAGRAEGAAARTRHYLPVHHPRPA